jgi:hypothetical protein
VSDLNDTWAELGDAAYAFALDNDLVDAAVSLRPRLVDPTGNEEDVILSNATCAMLVHDLEMVTMDQDDDEPVVMLLRMVLPRGWRSGHIEDLRAWAKEASSDGA